MHTLSLPPRFDLFRFLLPDTFLPEPIVEKYTKVINKDKNVIVKPIDYLNESIITCSIPGLSDLTMEQHQHSVRTIMENRTSNGIPIEPERKQITYAPTNPLSNIENEFRVEFRKNQGLYNYFMMYETILLKYVKSFDGQYLDQVFWIDILDETGIVVARIRMVDPRIDGIEGMEFGYNKVERSEETFTVTFKFNNIEFEFL